VLSDEAKARIIEIRGQYPDPKSVTMPALDIAQREKGWLSAETLLEIAEFLGLPPAEVRGVASFYTMYRLKPMGKYLIQICTNVSCSLMGADALAEYLRKKLGVEEGDTTRDGRFSWIQVQCLGSCGTAPVMQINDTYYEALTKEKVDRILKDLP
jgi:NADH-quinone oxidoreductase E subunit